MEQNEKIVFICTAGPTNPEKATLPFVIATAALAMDVAVTMILQSDAVELAREGVAEQVNAKGFLPFKQLLDSFLEQEGVMMLCSPCLKERNIGPDQIIKNAQVIAAGTVVIEMMSATNVVSY